MEKSKPTAPLSFTRHVEHQSQRQCSTRDERSRIEFELRDIEFYCTDGAENLRRGRSEKRVSPTAIRNLAFQAIQNLGASIRFRRNLPYDCKKSKASQIRGNANVKVLEKRIPTPLVPARQQLIPTAEKF